MKKHSLRFVLLLLLCSTLFSSSVLAQTSPYLSPVMISGPSEDVNNVFDQWKSYVADYDPLVINPPDCITNLDAAASVICLQENLNRLHTRLDEILILSSTIKLTMERDNPPPEGSSFSAVNFNHIYALDALVQTWKTAVHFQCQFESLDYHFSEAYPLKQLQCLENYTHNFLAHVLMSLELCCRSELVKELSPSPAEKGLLPNFDFRRTLMPKEFFQNVTSSQLELYPCSEINDTWYRQACFDDVRNELEEDVKELTSRLESTYRHKQKAGFIILGMDPTWRAVALSECEFISSESFTASTWRDHVSICFSDHLKIRAEYLKTLLKDE